MRIRIAAATGPAYPPAAAAGGGSARKFTIAAGQAHPQSPR